MGPVAHGLPGRLQAGAGAHQALGVVDEEPNIADRAPADAQPRQALLPPEATHLAARYIAVGVVCLACNICAQATSGAECVHFHALKTSQH